MTLLAARPVKPQRHMPAPSSGLLAVVTALPALIVSMALPLIVDELVVAFSVPLAVFVLIGVQALGSRILVQVVVWVGAAAIGVLAAVAGLPVLTFAVVGLFVLGAASTSWLLAQGRWPGLAAAPGGLLLMGALLAGLGRTTEGTVLAGVMVVVLALILLVTGPWAKTDNVRSPVRINMATIAALVALPLVVALTAGPIADRMGAPTVVSITGVKVEEATISGEPPDPFLSVLRWQLGPVEQERPLMTITSDPDAPSSPPVWASFPDYNGFSWTNSAGITVGGGDLDADGQAPDAAAQGLPVSTTVTVGVALPGQWVPVPQRVTQVLSTVATRVDEFTGIVTSASAPGGQSFVANYQMAIASQQTIKRSTPLAINDIDPSVRLPGGLPEQLVAIGDAVLADAGPQTWIQLTTLSEYFRGRGFQPLPPAALGAGPPDRSYAGLVDVVATGEGFQEQYAALWALIARSWGVPTRLIISWAPPEVSDDSTEVTIFGRDTNVWAQARLKDLGWVTFHPSVQDRLALRPAVQEPLSPNDVSPPEPTPAPEPDSGGGEQNGGGGGGEVPDEAPSSLPIWASIFAAVSVALGWVVWVVLRRRRQRRALLIGASRPVALATTEYVRALYAEAGHSLPFTWAPAALAVTVDGLPHDLSDALDTYSQVAAPLLYGAPVDGEHDANNPPQWLHVLTTALIGVEQAIDARGSWLLRLRRVLVPLRLRGAVEEFNDAASGVNRLIV